MARSSGVRSLTNSWWICWMKASFPDIILRIVKWKWCDEHLSMVCAIWLQCLCWCHSCLDWVRWRCQKFCQNHQDIRKKLITLIVSLCLVVLQGRRCQAYRFDSVPVNGKIHDKYTDVLGINCSLPVENQGSTVRMNGSNIILRAFCYACLVRSKRVLLYWWMSHEIFEVCILHERERLWAFCHEWHSTINILNLLSAQ